MMDEEVLRYLEELGLTSSEARVYVALLDASGVRVAEIARLANLPRSRAYAVLESLVARGLVTEIPAVFKRFEAVDAETAVGRLIEERRRRLEKDARRARAVVDALSGQAAPHAPADATRAEASAFMRLLQETEQEFVALIRGGEFQPPVGERPFPVSRGRVRVVVESHARHPLVNVPGVDARVRAHVPVSFAVKDGETVLLPDAKGQNGGPELLRKPRVADVLLAAFEAVWAESESPEARPA